MGDRMSRGELGITTIIMQNTDHLWLCQGSYESAAIAANDLLGVAFSPRSVKEVRQRTIRLGDKDFVETALSYYSPQEQHALFVKWLMQLGVGEGFAKVGSVIRFIRITPTRLRVTNEEVEEWRKQQPWITKPETLYAERSTKSTRTQSVNASTQESTPLTRLQRRGQTD